MGTKRGPELLTSKPRRQWQTAEQDRERRASRVISTGPGGAGTWDTWGQALERPLPRARPPLRTSQGSRPPAGGRVPPISSTGPALFPLRQPNLPGAQGRGLLQFRSPDPGPLLAPGRAVEVGIRVIKADRCRLARTLERRYKAGVKMQIAWAQRLCTHAT